MFTIQPSLVPHSKALYCCSKTQQIKQLQSPQLLHY